MRRVDVRLGAVAERPSARRCLSSLCEELSWLLEAEVTARELPSYAAVFDAIDQGLCDMAWCPPIVAYDLLQCGSGRPIAAAIRSGAAVYYSALITQSETFRLRDLIGSNIGWVAPESAAGFTIPRLHLRSFGIDPERCFRGEWFAGSHARAVEALRLGRVDAIATYAHMDSSGALVMPWKGAHVITATGPIPSDCIVVHPSVTERQAARWAEAFCGLPQSVLDGLPAMRIDGFRAVGPSHLRSLSRIRRHSDQRPLRSLMVDVDVPRSLRVADLAGMLIPGDRPRLDCP